MRLGSPVTSLSFSPAGDLLATTHVDQRGVYLWSNQLIFGSGADVVASEVPINVRLPSVGSAGKAKRIAQQPPGGGGAAAIRAMLGRTAAAQRAAAAGASASAAGAAGWAGDDDHDGGFASDTDSGSEISVPGSDEESDGDGSVGQRGGGEGGSEEEEEDVAAVCGRAAYSARDTVSGTPIPLVPRLVTLSLLPRTQWQNLAHLDTIKVGVGRVGVFVDEDFCCDVFSGEEHAYFQE
jgi:hypothetical protein